MVMLKYAVILMLGILLFGCVSNDGGAYNITNYTNGNPDKNLGDDTGVQPGALEISVPSELTASVGTLSTYSFSATGGRPPYTFTLSKISKVAYDGSKVGTGLSQLQVSENGQLALTPERGEEGEYVMQICASDNGDYHYYNPLCKNATLYIMSDIVKVKGAGKVSSSIVWDPRARVAVRGTAGDDIKANTRPEVVTLVPVSEIPSVSLTASEPAKSSSGGASVEIELMANSTDVSLSASGDSACGKNSGYQGSEIFNMDDFQAVPRETYVGLNITNDGTSEKVVDITISGLSAVDADSVYYSGANTAVYMSIGDCTNETCVDINPYPDLSPGGVAIGSEVVRTVVAPGSHVLWLGSITPDLSSTLGIKGCPSHAGISGRITITTAAADLGNGKMPIRRIYTSNFNSQSNIEEIG
jgi:hypothetical protein